MTRYVHLIFLFLLAASLATAFEHFGISQGSLSTLQHGVTGDVYIANENTFIVTNFHYDGSAPDAFFWVGKTVVPDENGKIAPHALPIRKLGAYSGQEVIVKLPNGFNMSDVKSLSVWCREFTVDFGNVAIDGSNIPEPQLIGTFPPSSTHGVSTSGIFLMDAKTIKIGDFKYDGEAPDAFFLVGTGDVSSRGTKVPVRGQALQPLPRYTGQDVTLQLPGDMTVFDIAYISVYCIQVSQNFGKVVLPNPASLVTVPAFIPNDRNIPDNLPCKTIKSKKMNVYWKKDGDDLQITIKGIVDEEEYLAFGVSGLPDGVQMVGGDVAIAYARNGEVVLGDYYLNQKTACSGVKGVCLDESQGGEDNLRKESSQHIDGILTVTYRRSFLSDELQDKPFNPNGVTSVIAAGGDVDSLGQIKYHSAFYTKEPILIDFNDDSSICEPLTDDDPEDKHKPWAPSKIFNVTELIVQLGPTGGEKGYKAITGSASWGIAFYVNALLIPEITVVRGVTYKFIVEAGNNDRTNYHPLYITENSKGGQGSPGNKDKSGIIAGVTKDSNGNYIPTAGRLCKFETKPGQEDAWKIANSFAEYKASLVLTCQAGQPGTFSWTPNKTTPDLVYYQCWVHRNLGWKIHVTGSSCRTTLSIALVILTSMLKLLH